MSSQYSPRLEPVRFRIGASEWVVAKYCLDNGITRITAREIKTILGSPKNPLTLYSVIRKAIRDGLLKSVKKFAGVYEVDIKTAMHLTQLVPYDATNKNIHVSDVPQWRQAIDYAKSWQSLIEWANKSLASEKTSPPSPQGQAGGSGREGQPQPGSGTDPCKVPLPAVKYHIPIECVPTPSGRRALVAVQGNLYVLLEELRGTHYLQCVPFDSYVPGAKLCASKVDVLAKYLHRPAPERLKELQEEGERAKARALRELETIQALSELRPGTYNLTVHVNPDGSVSIEVEVPEEAGEGQVAGVTPGSRGQTGAMGTVPQTGGGGLVLYDPLAPPQLPRIRRTDPIKAPGTKDIIMVFDNVRYMANGQVQQMHGLQPMSTVMALADRLVYAEPGFQVYDPVLYELSKVMDIHIYHSKGKDPKGVIRIEARPRARALKKLGLAGVVHAFVTALHRLGGVFQAIAQAIWSRWTRLK
jgi:hypothetical protein